MLFPTVEFAIFFIIVLALAWASVAYVRLHKLILLVASYFFYGFWDWRFLPLLFGISLFSWVTATGLSQAKKSCFRKTWLGVGIIGCVSTLVYYKYAVFFELAWINTLREFGVHLRPTLLPMALPLGISFIVFHAISLLMDVYRGKLKTTGPLMDTLLYISFFPQLIAGPILRAASFLPQLQKSSPNPHAVKVSRGLLLIAIGLFKKVVIANALATGVVDDVFSMQEVVSSSKSLFAVYAYAAQIYCDFSGYTDIAIGCALLLGYRFPKNFDNPYIACSPQEFWHRWHISLSTWLRDYLFIPLGGSRHGLFRTCLNLLITMLLGGLWHGAAWTFVVWGAFHGLLLVTHRLWTQVGVIKNAVWRQGALWKWFSRIVLFHLICFGWVLFRAKDFDVVTGLLQQIFVGNWVWQDLAPHLVLVFFVAMGLQYLSVKQVARIERTFVRMPALLKGFLFASFILLIDLLGPTGVAPFIYFQF